ncbi:MAG TPA: hypothetical protein VIJ70_03315 [Gaiellaceae bacterium]
MLSHQPEVALLLHREHVERLIADAQRPLQRPSSRSPLHEPSRAARERQRRRAHVRA